jgi:hypothetical protein
VDALLGSEITPPESARVRAIRAVACRLAGHALSFAFEIIVMVDSTTEATPVGWLSTFPVRVGP